MITHIRTESRVEFTLTDAPRLPLPFAVRPDSEYLPDQATIVIETTPGLESLATRASVRGFRIKSDGTVGVQVVVGEYFMYRDETPEYIQEIATAALEVVKGQRS